MGEVKISKKAKTLREEGGKLDWERIVKNDVLSMVIFSAIGTENMKV